MNVNPKRSDEDFDREIRAHIEIETERRIDDGMPPDEARVAARRRFGNVTVARERFYEAGRLLWLDHLMQDVRCAARSRLIRLCCCARRRRNGEWP